MEKFIIIGCLMCLVSCNSTSDNEWKIFKITHGKVYDSLTEEYMRWKIWKDNKEAVDLHNKMFQHGEFSYEKKLNQFSDLTFEEFESQYTGYKPMQRERDYEEFSESELKAPKSMDWRKRGAVTRVKSQNPCNSCYAFATTGAIEAQHFIATKKLVELSEQQIIDCGEPTGQGCKNGGHMITAFKYIVKAGGIDTDRTYPFVGRAQKCLFNRANAAVTIGGYKTFKPNEKALQAAVASKGPVSVGMVASSDFQHYAGGIFKGKCGGQMNHAVLVIGYGTDKGQDYWLIKNSWVS